MSAKLGMSLFNYFNIFQQPELSVPSRKIYPLAFNPLIDLDTVFSDLDNANAISLIVK